MMNEVQYYNDIRLNYIDDINDLLILGYRSKAILSFKYDHLNFVINTMQILIIFISAALTLMESIKTYYNSENEAIDITAILFTSFIGIIMTLYRFLKLENKKERTGNILESFNLVLNKLQRVKNTMENMVIKSDNTDEWVIISNTYTSEILGTYIGIKEAYDNNFSYKEALHYKTKYGKFLLQENHL
jgi:heme/copper-type cytochrome/quinol oxidase subunit 4